MHLRLILQRNILWLLCVDRARAQRSGARNRNRKPLLRMYRIRLRARARMYVDAYFIKSKRDNCRLSRAVALIRHR